MDWDLKWLPVWSSNGELENSDRGVSVAFPRLLAADPVTLFFWFLFISVHPIIKNGERGATQRVNI